MASEIVGHTHLMSDTAYSRAYCLRHLTRISVLPEDSQLRVQLPPQLENFVVVNMD